MEFKTNPENLENSKHVKKSINYDDLIIEDGINYDEIIFNSVRIANNHETSKNLYDVINNLSLDIEYLFIDVLYLGGFKFDNLPITLKKIFINDWLYLGSNYDLYKEEIDNIFKLPFGCEICFLYNGKYNKMITNENYILNSDCRLSILIDEYEIFNINQ